MELRIYGRLCINGDGYTDLVIADPCAGNDAGIIWIYLGSKNGPDATADLILCGEGVRYYFGTFISTGDINADGYDDLVISSPSDCIADFGRVYVYLGGDTLDKDPDWFYQSTDEGANYGASIECGDINNDGFDDWIVLASYSMTEKPAKLYIYSGGDSLSLEPVYKYESQQYTGGRTEYISNWNNSEYGMLLTGYLRTEEINHGVLAIYGSDNFDNFKIDTIISPFGPGDMCFLYGIAYGYLNGDEYKDILIESDYYIMDTSSICVYLGENDFSQPDTIFSFREDSSRIALKGTIDLNADGIDEVLILRRMPGDQGYKNCYHYIDIYSHKPFPVVGIKEENIQIQKNFKLGNNYPNPFNATTHIPIVVPHTANIKITVLNLLGQEIAILNDRIYKRGEYTLEWSPDNLSSGIYLVKMSVENSQKIKTLKMLLMK